MKIITKLLAIGIFILGNSLYAQPFGTRFIDTHDYENCIELSNGSVRVVLEPNCGGRVLLFELNGENVLFVRPDQNGVVYTGEYITNLCAGRFDIGPEKITPQRPELFFGKFEAEITGHYSARMISPVSENLGIQIIRDFKLDPKDPKLSCTQTIKNISEQTQRYCTWSRTFAEGGGICLCPLNPESRFPDKYILYGSNNTIEYAPEPDKNLRVRDNILEMLGPPEKPKNGIDASEGWLAYLTQKDILFLKTFPVYPDEVYGTIAAYNVSIYFVEKFCEIEPMSPWFSINPGESRSFTEDWWLYEFDFPEDRVTDLDAVRKLVEKSED